MSAGQRAVMPPSITKALPVMKAYASEARETAASAISSG
jgi:hypothetical protein